MNRKAAIELSVNMLVMLIISLVVFGMGMTILYKLYGHAEEQKAELDLRTQEELQRLLIDEGKRVALPLHSATLYPGEQHVFGLGITNVDVSEEVFYLNVYFERAFDKENVELDISSYDLSSWLLFKPELRIKQGESHQEPILVNVPSDAEKGTYVGVVKVCEELTGSGDARDSESCKPEDQYGNTQTFTLLVQ